MNAKPIRNRHGISLMEVLASTFVIGVGLLGVLAVIPFGAFQISKANNVEQSAILARNAYNEIQTQKLYEFKKLCRANKHPSLTPPNFDLFPEHNITVTVTTDETPPGVTSHNYGPFFDCGQMPNSTTPPPLFFFVDPLNTSDSPLWGDHAVKFRNPDLYKNTFYSQDELIANPIKEARPTLLTSTTGDPQFQGHYSWLMMFSFQNADNYPTLMNAAQLESLHGVPSGLFTSGAASVTIGGITYQHQVTSGNLLYAGRAYANSSSFFTNNCLFDLVSFYNRVPGDAAKERQLRIVNQNPDTYPNETAPPFPANTNYNQYMPTPLLNGATVTIYATTPEELEMKNIKWVLLTWHWRDTSPAQQCYSVHWYKVVSQGDIVKVDTDQYVRTITITGKYFEAQQTTGTRTIRDHRIYLLEGALSKISCSDPIDP